MEKINPTPGVAKRTPKVGCRFAAPGVWHNYSQLHRRVPKRRRHRRAGATMIVTVLCAVSRTSLHYSGPGSRWAFGPALALSGLGLDLRGPSHSSGSESSVGVPFGPTGSSSPAFGAQFAPRWAGPRPPVRRSASARPRSASARPSVLRRRSVGPFAWRVAGGHLFWGRTPGGLPVRRLGARASSGRSVLR